MNSTDFLKKPMLNGLDLTEDNFKSPPMEMGILPFWFWNGELDNDEMEWQMKEYLDKGVTGIFIHGRFGLAVPYLSPEWFQKVKVVVDKGRELGLDIWIYDEMNWPSGTAERKVPQKYPHLRQKYLELVVLDVAGPLFTYLEATDSRYVNTGNSKPIVAYACSAEEFESGIVNLIDLTPNLSFEKVIPWEAPEGQWKLLYFLEKEADYYIDALDPESTQRFLEITHEQYKESVGDDFGGIVPGFYTDEPAMHYYHVGHDNYVIPWSNKMFKIFRDRCGYDLKSVLPALFLNMGPKTGKIRFDFWNAISDQYTDSYYKQIRQWCDKNNVVFTGHLLFEEWMRAHARCEGNIFNHLKQMHLTGVDHLYPKIGTESEPDQHVALKIGSSAAHHFGSERLLCESMGGTYWDCTLERMKWMANWEYVLGVNLFNNHGYHYSIEGERKRDWPPSQFYHHTWWKYYNYFTEYMARLGHILSGGQHVAKILLVYPLNSIWAHYTPQKRTSIGDIIEYDVYYLTDTLLRLHHDFDFVDEEVLISSEVKEGRIHIADESYELVILPPMTHIRRGSLQRLNEFVNSGGKLIGGTLLPEEFVDDGESTHDEIQSLFGLHPEKVNLNFASKPERKVFENRFGQVQFIQGPGLSVLKDKNLVKSTLEKAVTPDVAISVEDIFYLHRVKNDWDVYFLVNTSRNPMKSVEISLEKQGKPEIWDPNTGEIKAVHGYKIKNDRVCFSLDFPSSEGLAILVREDIPDVYVTESNVAVESISGKQLTAYGNSVPEIKIDLMTGKGKKTLKSEPGKTLPPIEFPKNFDIKLEQPNNLLIDQWKMSQNESGPDNVVADPGFNDSDWLDVTVGAWEMQLPQERDDESYPVTLWYRTVFSIVELPETLDLMVDGFSGDAYTVFVNGSEIRDKGKRSYLDAEIKEVPVRGYVKTGENTVAVKLTVNKRTNGILDHLKLIGNFALYDDNTIISAPGSLTVGDWTEQGLPYYSGTVNYSCKLNVPEEYLSGKLFLEADCGEDVIEVWTNGKMVKVLPWRPYVLDITIDLVPGENEVTLKVTNTLINILEKKKTRSGLLNSPRIVHYPKYTLEIT